MSFSNLPQELLTHIFSYYVESEGLYNLMNCIASVSKEWEMAAMNPSLWKVVDDSSLNRQHLRRASRKGLLSHTVRLNLIYQARELNASDLKCILGRCPRLNHLDLTRNTVSKGILAYVAMQCSNIESLILSDVKTTITVSNMSPIFNAYGPHLKCLNLSNNSFAKFHEVMKKIAETCHSLQEMRVANMSGTGLSFPLAKMQIGCPKLKVLELGSCTYALEGARETEGFPYLEEFLSSVRAGGGPRDEDLYYLLRHSRKLKVLNIQGCLVTDKNLLMIPSENLERLYLANSSVVDGIDLDRVMAKWKHSLKELDLSNTLSVHHIYAAIYALVHSNSEPCLEELHLSCTDINLRFLQVVIEKCHRLRYLNVTSCIRLPRGLDQEYSGRDKVEHLLTIRARLDYLPRYLL